MCKILKVEANYSNYYSVHAYCIHIGFLWFDNGIQNIWKQGIRLKISDQNPSKLMKIYGTQWKFGTLQFS